MEYSYEILVAEPKHKALSVRYFKDSSDYFKNFIVEDWSDSSTVTSVIHNFAPFVLEYWSYQDSVGSVSPIQVGYIGSDSAQPYSAPEEVNVSLADQQRMKRNNLLLETDFHALTDHTMDSNMTTYRQALRDVPTQAGFPETIEWPIKPV